MKKEKILMKKPSKNPDLKIKCIYEDDIAIITYPKDFGPIEKWFHNRIGGQIGRASCRERV